MGVVVQKYGGSSVADVDRIGRVAERIAATRDKGSQVVVVVSAMGDTTDELLALARKVSPDPHRRELDMLLTAGERISMALLSMALHARGVPAVSFTGSQSGIITDGAHTNARILEVRPVRIHEELRKGKVVIVAGYQGVSREREVTTLGRGGSDTTAVALAAALEAELCEICSDVDGVYTADPRVVPQWKKLSELSHDEMQELSLAGAKVLNAQAVEFARDKGIVIHARSTFETGAGTRIVPGRPRELRISGVTQEKEILVVAADDCAGVSGILERNGAWPRELWCEGSAAGLAIISLENVHGLPALLRDLHASPGTRIEEGLAQVSVVGSGVGASREPLERARRALGVPPRSILVSPLRISALVPREESDACVRRLHAEFVEGTSR
ncbi:MAG: aspartate kinase [Myxococcales bacterium]